MSELIKAFQQGFQKEAVKADLYPHQERVKEDIQKDPGKILYHGLGTGKTIGSIAAAEAVDKPTQVVAPASIRDQFKEEINEQSEKKPGGEDIPVESYHQLSRGRVGGDPGTVIFDEAHRLRNVDSQRTQEAKQMAENAEKRMLLTGTPIYNHPSDLANLVNIASGEQRLPSGETDFEEEFVEYKKKYPNLLDRIRGVSAGKVPQIKNKKNLIDKIKDVVDYEGKDVKNFPDVQEQEKEIEMSDEQSQIYRGLMSDMPTWARVKVKKNLPPNKSEASQLNSFLMATRQASDSPHVFDKDMTVEEGAKKSSKVQEIAESVEEEKKEGKKSLIYSNFIDAGIEPMAKELEDRGVKHKKFTGSLDDEERNRILKDYNQGNIDSLLVSSAGVEGLDTKETEAVHVMEPHWNESKIDQLIGRAARIGSHDNLPEERQKVDVKRYKSKPKPSYFDSLKKFLGGEEPTGADEYLMDRAKEKKELMDSFRDVMKEVG